MAFRATLQRLIPLVFAAMFVNGATAQNTYLIQNMQTGHFLSANLSSSTSQPVMVSSFNCNSVQLCYWTFANENQMILGGTSYALTYVAVQGIQNLFVQSLNLSDPNQIFEYFYNPNSNSNHLRNPNMPNMILDLLNKNTNEYAPVGLYKVNEGNNQNFTMIPTSMGSSCSSTSDAVTSSDGQSITCVNNNVGSQYSSFQNAVVSTRTGYNVSCSAGYVVCGTQATYLLNNPPIANGILTRVLFGELDFQCCALPQSNAYNYESVQNTVASSGSSLSFTCPNNGFLVGASTSSTSAQFIASFTFQCLLQQSVAPTGYGTISPTVSTTTAVSISITTMNGYGIVTPIVTSQPTSSVQYVGSTNNNGYGYGLANLGNGNIANVLSGSHSVSAGALQFVLVLISLVSLFW